jgi:hypothetical protein
MVNEATKLRKLSFFGGGLMCRVGWSVLEHQRRMSVLNHTHNYCHWLPCSKKNTVEVVKSVTYVQAF